MKKFELTFTQHNDGTIDINGNNDGFNLLEIIGLLKIKLDDLCEQANHPERFVKHTRTAIVATTVFRFHLALMDFFLLQIITAILPL